MNKTHSPATLAFTRLAALFLTVRHEATVNGSKRDKSGERIARVRKLADGGDFSEGMRLYASGSNERAVNEGIVYAVARAIVLEKGGKATGDIPADILSKVQTAWDADCKANPEVQISISEVIIDAKKKNGNRAKPVKVETRGVLSQFMQRSKVYELTLPNADVFSARALKEMTVDEKPLAEFLAKLKDKDKVITAPKAVNQ